MPANEFQGFQFVSALAGFVRQKTDEMKFVRRQSAGRQRGDQRAGAGHGFDAEAGGDGGFDHALAGIADARAAGVGDQRDLFAAPQSLDDFFAAFGFVELEIAEQRFGNFEVLEQLARAARVFRRDHVAFLEHAQRAQGDVLEIADRRGDEIKRAGRRGGKGFFICE